MIETKYNFGNIFMVATLIFAFLYGIWHFGRYYEKQQIKAIVNNMYQNMTDADFIIPSDLEYGGGIATGNCIFCKGLNYQYQLSRYIGF